MKTQTYRTAGTVRKVQVSKSPPDFIKGQRISKKAAEGIRYENRVQAYLQDLYGDLYLPSPWLVYANLRSSNRWAQPDGVLFVPEEWKIVIIEVKLQHTEAAYWQLVELYKPLLKWLWPSWSFALCEITKWYDPAVPFPTKINLCPAPHKTYKDSFGVHIWRP